MSNICVIDNSTLVNLTKLHHLSIFKILRNIFSKIYVPLAIKEEYENIHAVEKEPERKLVLNQMRLNSGFLAVCTNYDTIDLIILKTTRGIDPGEAEVAAQHKFVNSSFILSDDQNFIKSLRLTDPYIRVINSLHIIAWLDYSGWIQDPNTYLKEIFNHAPFSAARLRAAYVDTKERLGINISRRELSKRTSLKKLGLQN